MSQSASLKGVKATNGTTGAETGHVRPQLVRAGLPIILVGSALWAMFLLGSHVHAPTTDPDRSDCGASSLSINSEGSSIGGGELRVDQDAFDQACVDRATKRMQLSAVPALIFCLALIGTVIDRRRRKTPKQGNGGLLQPFSSGGR